MKLIFSLLLFFLFSSSCAHKSATVLQQTETSTDFLPIIDAHTHTRFSHSPEATSGIEDTEEVYRLEMKKAGVVATISMLGTDESGYAKSIQDITTFCYGVGETSSLTELKKGLKEKKYGCVKIYLGYIHKFAYDKFYRPYYKLASQYDVPVVFHTGDTYSIKGKLKFSDPLTIDEVAVDFPKTRFVIAHMGNPWIQSAAEVAYKNPNVYLEASAILIGDLKEKPPGVVDSQLVQPLRWAFQYLENPEKFIFGTDWPLTGMKDYADAFKLAIPRKYWCKVFYENAANIYKLPMKYKCNIH